VNVVLSFGIVILSEVALREAQGYAVEGSLAAFMQRDVAGDFLLGIVGIPRRAVDCVERKRNPSRAQELRLANFPLRSG